MSDKDYSDRQYGDIAMAVTSDPNRRAEEKETAVYFSNVDDRLTVTTSNPAICRRVLLHPEFELSYYEISTGSNTSTTVDADEYAEDGHDGRRGVYMVTGTMPIGVLKISQNARKSSGSASVVTGAYL